MRNNNFPDLAELSCQAVRHALTKITSDLCCGAFQLTDFYQGVGPLIICSPLLVFSFGHVNCATILEKKG